MQRRNFKDKKPKRRLSPIKKKKNTKKQKKFFYDLITSYVFQLSIARLYLSLCLRFFDFVYFLLFSLFPTPFFHFQIFDLLIINIGTKKKKMKTPPNVNPLSLEHRKLHISNQISKSMYHIISI